MVLKSDGLQKTKELATYHAQALHSASHSALHSALHGAYVVLRCCSIGRSSAVGSLLTAQYLLLATDLILFCYLPTIATTRSHHVRTTCYSSAAPQVYERTLIIPTSATHLLTVD